jgi:hypothetical protein
VCQHSAGPLTGLAPVAILVYTDKRSVNGVYTGMLKKSPAKRQPAADAPKKLGRPYSGGRDPITPIRLPVAMVAAIDAWAQKAGTSRSAAVRLWIEAGLKRRPKA